MSSRTESPPDGKRLHRVVCGIFIAAVIINLGANLLAGIGGPVGGNVSGPLAPTGALCWVIGLSKSLLVPSLAGLFVLSSRGQVLSIRRNALHGALLFCWLGDIALLFKAYFIHGMAAFAISHLFFIGAYSKGIQWRTALSGRRPLLVMPFVAYGYMIYMTLYFNLPPNPAPNLQDRLSTMALPLFIYMVVLLSNGMTCLLRLLQKRSSSDTFIFLGVVLFIQSDSIIAMTEYVDALPVEGFAIMLTYIVGLFLMVDGCRSGLGVPARQRDLQTVPLSATA